MLLCVVAPAIVRVPPRDVAYAVTLRVFDTVSGPANVEALLPVCTIAPVTVTPPPRVAAPDIDSVLKHCVAPVRRVDPAATVRPPFSVARFVKVVVPET